jgi:hypothetical protein
MPAPERSRTPLKYTFFQDAVRIGRKIRAAESFAREPGEDYRRPDFVRVATEPRGAVSPGVYAGGEMTLCEGSAGRITGLPPAIWNFSVSGYRLLPRWLEARTGLPADLAFVRELRDICGRIAELIDLFAKADIVLEAALRESLTREALGFSREGQDANGGSDRPVRE